MKKNVGTVDAYLRITCGLIGLVYSAMKMKWRPNSALYQFVLFCSAMKVAEGITRFCPMLQLLNRDTLDNQYS